MTDELRDVQAIRADLTVLNERNTAWREAVAEVRTGIRKRLPSTAALNGNEEQGRLANDVEPLLAALADRDAKLAAVEALLPNTDEQFPIVPDQIKAALGATLSDYLLIPRAALSLSVPTSPVDRCEQCGDDRAISAGPNCTEPNDHYPSKEG